MVKPDELNILVQAKIDPKGAIYRLLVESPEDYYNIQQISNYLELSRPTVSKHCNNLVKDGKFGVIKEGRCVLYYVNRERLVA